MGWYRAEPSRGFQAFVTHLRAPFLPFPAGGEAPLCQAAKPSFHRARQLGRLLIARLLPSAAGAWERSLVSPPSNGLRSPLGRMRSPAEEVSRCSIGDPVVTPDHAALLSREEQHACLPDQPVSPGEEIGRAFPRDSAAAAAMSVRTRVPYYGRILTVFNGEASLGVVPF